MLGGVIEFFVNNPVIALIILTFLPFLELRASIPYGVFKTDLHWTVVFLICVVTNIILGPIIYGFLNYFIHLFLKIKIIDKIWQKYIEKLQKRIHKYIERWGLLGVSIFIGIPLPGSGSYSGAIGSYILGIGFKRFVLANIFGVLIAGVVVTIISLTGSQAFNFLIKII